MGSFQIPSTPPTTNKTIRFPNDVVEAVEQAIQGKNCTFSAFVIAAVRAALEDLSSPDSLPQDSLSDLISKQSFTERRFSYALSQK